MGYRKLPIMRDYWSQNTELHASLLADSMLRRRFKVIRKLLHYCNNYIQPDPNYDKGYKVRPLLDNFNKAFKNIIYYELNLLIHEHIINFHRHYSLKQ